MKLKQIISAVLITALFSSGASAAVFGGESSNAAEVCESTAAVIENGGLINLDFGSNDVDLLNVNSGIAMIDEDGSLESYNTDLSSLKYVTAPKDQSNLGTCWAFSAASCIETLLMKLDGAADASNSKYDFSELHAALAASSKFLQDGTYGYQTSYTDGGNGLRYAMYSTRAEDTNIFTGPVADSAMEYTVSASEIAEIDSDDMDVDTVGYFPGTFNLLDFNSTELTSAQKTARNDIIKDLVDSYGSVSIAIYSGSTYSSSYNSFKNTDYEDNDNYTLFYEAEQTSANHAVTIVGYDDSFDADIFYDAGFATPAMDGAFIVKNSWGESWGENGGYFYMSYDSYLDYIYAFGDLISRNTYDYEYDYTPYLPNGKYAYNFSDSKGNFLYQAGGYANYFEKQYEGSEKINKISVYVLSADCELNLYVDKDDTDGKFNDFQPVKVESIGSGSGSYTVSSDGYTVTVPYAGNYVFELAEPVETDNNFTVGVYGKTTNTNGVVALETTYNGVVTHNCSGNSYASSALDSNLANLSGGDFAIRAYTKKVPVEVTVDGKVYEADYGTALSEVLSDNGISEAVYEAVNGETNSYRAADTTAEVTENITLYTGSYIYAPTIKMENYQTVEGENIIRFVGEITDNFYTNVEKVTALGFVYSADGGEAETSIECGELYEQLENYSPSSGVYLFKSDELDKGSYTVSAYVTYSLADSGDVITVYTAEKTLS